MDELVPKATVSPGPIMTTAVYAVTIDSPEDTVYVNEFEVHVTTYASGKTFAVPYWADGDPLDWRDKPPMRTLADVVRELRRERWIEDEKTRWQLSCYPPDDAPDDDLDAEVARREAANPYTGPRPFPG